MVVCFCSRAWRRKMSGRDFGVIIFVSAAAWCAVPAVAAPMPDFTGMWRHQSLPGFEPLASGPTSLTNLSRANGVSNYDQLVGDYNNPILKPEAASIVKKFGEMSKAGITYPSPANQCWPEPVPYIFKTFGMEMLQEPDQITFMYDEGPDARRVRLNQPHPANVKPSWYGDSVGHYEGDTLVIDTIGVKADRPHAMVDMFGTPFSAALHVVERYRMVDYEEAQAAVARNLTVNPRVPDTASDQSYRGKRLQVVFTVDDARMFTMPWSGAITYEKPGQEWDEIVCADNPFDFFAEKNGALVPTAAKPDF